MAAAKILVGFAVVLVLGGLTAFLLAPEGANKATALIVPGACAALLLACAWMASMLKRNRRLGMIGIHVGLALTALLGLVFAMQGFSRAQQASSHRAAVERFEGAELAGAATTDEGLAAYLEAQEVKAYDTMYLAVIFCVLSAAGFMTLFLLVLNRPKPEARGDSAEAPAVGG